MKKRILAFLFVMVLLLSSCTQEPVEPIQGITPPATSVDEPQPAYSYDGTIFTYAGQSYDLSERNQMVNSIMSCTPVGEYIVIDGHTGPQNSVYNIFNTESLSFEPDICGVHLIWYDDDITTAVYSFWSDVYTYGGQLLATLPLSEGDLVYNLKFTEDHSKVEATILANDGGERVETVNISN